MGSQTLGSGRGPAIVLTLLLLLARLIDPPPLRELRLKTFDAYQRIMPRAAGERWVEIVDVDEKSLARYGQWPWPRNLLANLVERLTQSGAVVIAFDMVFPEPDRSSPEVFGAGASGLAPDLRARLAALPSNDALFAKAIRAGRVVVGEAAEPEARSPPRVTSFGVATLGADPAPFLPHFPGLLTNLPAVEAAAAGHGLLTVLPESDAIVRRALMVAYARGALVASLSLETLRFATGHGTLLIKADDAGIASLNLANVAIPVDSSGRIWIYFNVHDPKRFVSAADVLDGAAAADLFTGKIVLVGTSAAGLVDLKATPLDPAEPGGEIQAQILDAILSGDILSEPSYAVGVEILAALLGGGALIVVAPSLSAAGVVLLGLCIAGLLVGGSWLAFARARLLFDFTFPLLACASVYGALVFANYFREQRQRRQIRSAFGRYLSPALVEQLSRAPEKLVLGGETRELTVMFSDLRGFSAIAERYRDDPQGLTALMNSLFSPLTEAILEGRGAIDKYMGDAIMAFWNAPLDDADHPANACASALAMREKLDTLNRENEMARTAGAGAPPLQFGIGLNTGRCVVGNMGSARRFDYSVLGDAVNLASRLEGQSKTYGVDIVAGSRTAQAVTGRFALVELDRIRVKGKNEPETIFALLGDGALGARADFVDLRDCVAAMLACYRERDWAGAREKLRLARRSDAEGRLEVLLSLYSARIGAYEREAPPPDWDGVFTATMK